MLLAHLIEWLERKTMTILDVRTSKITHIESRKNPIHQTYNALKK